MTAYQLQKDLGTEIESILKDILLKNIEGKKTQIKAFGQSLPKRMQQYNDKESDDAENENVYVEGADVEDDKNYPYCLVMLDSGNIGTLSRGETVNVNLIFGIFDDDLECKGSEVILNMIQRVSQRFIKYPALNGQYRLNTENGIEWVLDQEDRYPFYYGAMSMAFDMFFVEREDTIYD